MNGLSVTNLVMAKKLLYAELIKRANNVTVDSLNVILIAIGAKPDYSCRLARLASIDLVMLIQLKSVNEGEKLEISMTMWVNKQCDKSMQRRQSKRYSELEFKLGIQYSNSSDTSAIMPRMSPRRMRAGSILEAMIFLTIAFNEVGPQPKELVLEAESTRIIGMTHRRQL